MLGDTKETPRSRCPTSEEFLRKMATVELWPFQPPKPPGGPPMPLSVLLPHYQQRLLEAADEIARLRATLDAIRLHGTDMPAAGNYSEAEWWRWVASDCIRIAADAIQWGGNDGADE